MLNINEAEISQINLLVEMNKKLVNDENYDRPLSHEKLVERWHSFFSDKYRIYIFEKDSKIVGYCVIHDDQDPKYIRHFYIKDEFRGKNLGRTAFELLLKELNVSEIDLDVMHWNKDGIAFWKALGFKERYLGMTFKK
jgi:RimJ/RimL family protein N-acetyltransferase